MKKIVSLIVLVVFVASCSNDENEEILNNEIKKIEAKASSKSDYLAKDGEVVLSSAGTDTIAPPPPIYSDPGGFCEQCDIDPPKGGTKP